MWHRWMSLLAFSMWHDAACAALGIPHPGYNAATGEIDTAAQWTTAYTQPTVVAEDDVRAFIDNHVATMVPEGLGMPCDPPKSEFEF